MATGGIRNLEWLDRASGNRYPLQPVATATDLSGAFRLPNDFIAAIYLAVPADLRINLTSVYISEVVHTPNLISLVISTLINNELRNIARADLSLVAIANQIRSIGYGVGLLEGMPDYTDIRGRISIARLENIQLQPVGVFAFDYSGAGLDVDAIRPAIRHVSAIEVETVGGQFTRLNGPVRLRAGNNTRLRLATEDGEPVIYFDAFDTTGFNDDFNCEDTSAAAIRRINGIRGNSNREVLIQDSRCVDVTASGDALTIRNPCSEPCAGCEEAEAIKRSVDPMAQQIPTLVNFIARLGASIESQQQAIAASQGPLQCLTDSENTDGLITGSGEGSDGPIDLILDEDPTAGS